MKKGKFRFVTTVLVLFMIVYYLVPLVFPKLQGVGFTSKQLKLGLDLQGGMRILLGVDTKGLTLSDKQESQVVESALEIIRNRVDEFGVSEPTIQRVGNKRISVSLPGIKDFESAQEIIGKTALLQFNLLGSNVDLSETIVKVDEFLKNNLDEFPYIKAIFDDQESDVSQNVLEENVDQEDTKYSKMFSMLLNYQGEQNLIVAHRYTGEIKKLFKNETFRAFLPKEYSFNLGKLSFDQTGMPTYMPVYFLLKKTELTGKYLKDAQVKIGQNVGGIQTNDPYISLEFDKIGKEKFANITSRNIRERLAIVLDDIVYMAPTIQTKIVDGVAQITGKFTLAEVQNLVIVLRAGNLPAPVEIIEKRSVGPTLGSDSIKAGLMAGLIGLAVILLFMIAYYRLSGFLAVMAVGANILFILATLTMLSATLTMPGIAGIVLTIGMAVDACVLIFERIKEELATNRTIKSAITTGFDKAFLIIVDANITTLITAIVLYKFGSGPIKGFAVTLSIGIVGSLFASLILVKIIFDKFITQKNLNKLSI